MIATFATTTNLFIKNKERHEKFKKVAAHPWYFEEEFFYKHNARRELPDDLKELW